MVTTGAYVPRLRWLPPSDHLFLDRAQAPPNGGFRGVQGYEVRVSGVGTVGCTVRCIINGGGCVC